MKCGISCPTQYRYKTSAGCWGCEYVNLHTGQCDYYKDKEVKE